MKARPWGGRKEPPNTGMRGPRSSTRFWIIPLLAFVCLPGTVSAQSLRGSMDAMQAQNRQARDHDFTFMETPSHVYRFRDQGLLVHLPGNGSYQLDDEVSFPYARPEVKTFVERLASQYRRACGETLVVTSLTRPLNRQPRNSSPLSVHPTGMAVDLRRSTSRACRGWLEDVLLHLEGQGALNATYERRPPHYHIAVYPRQYARYVSRLAAERVLVEEPDEVAMPSRAEAVSEQVMLPGVVRYEVRSGDSLWGIARAHGTTVDRLKSANNLSGSRIYAGQLLEVPVISR